MDNDEKKLKKPMNPYKKSSMIFIALVFIIPCINFLVLNIGGIINTGYLAFIGYSDKAGYYWNNFQNFKDIWSDIVYNPLILTGIKTSLVFFGLSWVMLFISLVISFYIYKNYPGSSFFRVLFVMPGMVASMVWVRIFKYFVELAVPELFGLDYGLLTTLDTIMPTLMGYGIWLGFAGNMILFVGCMSGINHELVEAGWVDGMGIIGEFYHIVLPGIWPVLSISIITSPMSIFMSGPPLYEFYDTLAHESLYSISYFLQVKVLSTGAGIGSYAYSAAFAWILTLIVAPLTFLVRYLCEHYGPNED